eukprot:322893_1
MAESTLIFQFHDNSSYTGIGQQNKTASTSESKSHHKKRGAVKFCVTVLLRNAHRFEEIRASNAIFGNCRNVRDIGSILQAVKVDQYRDLVKCIKQTLKSKNSTRPRRNAIANICKNGQNSQ